MSVPLESGWKKVLSKELEKLYVKALSSFLKDERERYTIYPPQNLVFNAFWQTPFEEVKVVIVGQDPYHGPGQAQGLSFSVPEGVRLPPSLKNIYKELAHDLKVKAPENGSLLSWAKQGVLLLNAVLTVRDGEPFSHKGRGWELFTDAALRALAERKEPLVFILWGKAAQDKVEPILEKNPQHHLILTAAHPSPYSATKFFGCRHFSKANDFLKKLGKEPICWT